MFFVNDWRSARYCGVRFLRTPTRRGRLSINHRHPQRPIEGKGCRDFASARARGWSHITLSAHLVEGVPFWKAVRPNGVPARARLEPDLVTAQFYTTCFTGVVVPYVCTTGSSVCGQ